MDIPTLQADNNAVPLKPTLWQALRAAFWHPMTQGGLGNAAWCILQKRYFSAAGHLVATLGSLATSFIVDRYVKDPAKKARYDGLAYMIRGVFNVAASVYGLAEYRHNLENGTAPADLRDPNLRETLFGNVSTMSWGEGNIFMGIKKVMGKKGDSALGMFFYSAADCEAGFMGPHPDIMPLAAAGAGTAKIIIDKLSPPREGGLMWHLTPARILSTIYMTHAIREISHNPYYLFAHVPWTACYLLMDEKQNKALPRDVKRAARALLAPAS